jgi:hypothetical protein
MPALVTERFVCASVNWPARLPPANHAGPLPWCLTVVHATMTLYRRARSLHYWTVERSRPRVAGVFRPEGDTGERVCVNRLGVWRSTPKALQHGTETCGEWSRQHFAHGVCRPGIACAGRTPRLRDCAGGRHCGRSRAVCQQGIHCHGESPADPFRASSLPLSALLLGAVAGALATIGGSWRKHRCCHRLRPTWRKIRTSLRRDREPMARAAVAS